MLVLSVLISTTIYSKTQFNQNIYMYLTVIFHRDIMLPDSWTLNFRLEEAADYALYYTGGLPSIRARIS
jgi:hypothetical protein